MRDLDFGAVLPLADARTLGKTEDKWGRLLSKKLMALARAETPNWYNIRFNKQWTPLHIAYNKRKKEIRVWGDPPNENVDGSKGGATERVPIIGKPKPIEIRESRVIGSTRTFGSKSMWITPKTFQPRTAGGMFKSGTSHSDITIKENEQGKKLYKKSGSRKYPFAAMWKMEDGKAEFVPADESLADKLLSCPEFEDLLWESLFEAIDTV